MPTPPLLVGIRGVEAHHPATATGAAKPLPRELPGDDDRGDDLDARRLVSGANRRTFLDQERHLKAYAREWRMARRLPAGCLSCEVLCKVVTPFLRSSRVRGRVRMRGPVRAVCLVRANCVQSGYLSRARRSIGSLVTLSVSSGIGSRAPAGARRPGAKRVPFLVFWRGLSFAVLSALSLSEKASLASLRRMQALESVTSVTEVAQTVTEVTEVTDFPIPRITRAHT